MSRDEASQATSRAVRAAIQQSGESLKTLAARYGVNPKTIQKWRRRDTTDDLPRGSKQHLSTILTEEEEAIALAFRRRTGLPLDDCLYALQTTIPSLTRSSLYRCFRRHGVGRLEDGGGPLAGMSSSDALGNVVVDVNEIDTADGTLHLFQAIDRASKLVFAAFYDRIERATENNFVQALIDGFPFRLQSLVLDAGLFHDDAVRVPEISDAASERLDSLCARHGIAYRVWPGNHRWTVDQVTRARRILNAASEQSRARTRHEIEERLGVFLSVYNFSRRLKSLGGLTPFEFICRAWRNAPDRFRVDPSRHIARLDGHFGRAPDKR